MKMKSTKETIKLVAVLSAVFAASFFIGPVACTNESDAKKALAGAGYTEIQITGWRPFMKSKDEWYSTGFSAKGPSGQTVTGAVTGGLLFKGYTIRTD